MRPIPEKSRVLLWIGVILSAGFLAACAAAYLAARDAVRSGVGEEVLPLAAEAIDAEIHATVSRPALIASTIAGSSFVRDWMAMGEEDPEAILRYLGGIQREYGALDAFLVSARTRAYYSPRGVFEDGAADAWLGRTRELKQSFLAEIETERATGNALTMVIHHRMTTQDGQFLGIAGIRMPLDALAALLDSHEKRGGRRIYLVDAQRRIILAGGTRSGSGRTIDQVPGIGAIADKLLQRDGKPSQLDYRHDGDVIFASARFMAEPGWHLIVEQDAAGQVQPLWSAFLLMLAAGAVATLLVLALTWRTIRRYDKRLDQMAGTDMLTGLLNRQAFDIVFHQAMLEAERGTRPYSCIVFDIDFLKQVNESCGHAAGDEALRSIARISRAVLRESDVITRWGGEEFIVLLKECTLEQAVAIAEKLRHSIDQHDFSPSVSEGRVTISLGVAQHETGETSMRFLQRADEALCKAKANGRNRLQVARTGSMEGFATGETA